MLQTQNLQHFFHCLNHLSYSCICYNMSPVFIYNMSPVFIPLNQNNSSSEIWFWMMLLLAFAFSPELVISVTRMELFVPV